MDEYKLINSKAISDHCRKIGHKFNTEELAVLIYRNKTMSIDEKIIAYNELIEKYPDMEVIRRRNCKPYESVKQMIQNEMNRLKRNEADETWLDINNICLDIPTPFKRGDLLVTSSDNLYIGKLKFDKVYFVLDHIIIWNDDFKERLKEGDYDSSDMQGPCYILGEDGKVYYSNVFEYDSWEFCEEDFVGKEKLLKFANSKILA